MQGGSAPPACLQHAVALKSWDSPIWRQLLGSRVRFAQHTLRRHLFSVSLPYNWLVLHHQHSSLDTLAVLQNRLKSCHDALYSYCLESHTFFLYQTGFKVPMCRLLSGLESGYHYVIAVYTQNKSDCWLALSHKNKLCHWMGPVVTSWSVLYSIGNYVRFSNVHATALSL